MTNQIPMKSSGVSKEQEDISSREKELEAELNFLRYQNSLADNQAFKVMLMNGVMKNNQLLEENNQLQRELINAIREGYSEDEVTEEPKESYQQSAKTLLKKKPDEPIQFEEGDEDEDNGDEGDDYDIMEDGKTKQKQRGRPRQ